MPLLMMLLACAEPPAPCVDATDIQIVFWGDCPDHGNQLLSGVTVTDASEAVMWDTWAPDGEETPQSAIIYGSVPSGWESDGEAVELTLDTTYTASIDYWDNKPIEVSFTPVDVD